MWSRLLPSATPRLRPGFPIPFRRHAAEDDAYTAALLAGCVIGIMLAWPMVLSEGARGRLLGTIETFAPAARVLAASEPRLPPQVEFAAPQVVHAAFESFPPASREISVAGIPERKDRPQQYVLAKRPETTAQSVVNHEAQAAASVRPAAESLPERLMLPEEAVPPVSAPVVEETATVELEIVFDINSSFLPPGAVVALKGLVSRLPADRPTQLTLQASVSDDGVKGARPGEAQRYNLWLAERRLERVATWLRQHAGADLAIEPGLREHDSSRRVVLSARHLP